MGVGALELAGVGIDDVALVDLYSCFPSAVRLGAASLGLDIDAQLTRTGGLSFAGGPWNNYVMHAIATIVGELRERPGDRALVWANGGYLTKHSFGIYRRGSAIAASATTAPSTRSTPCRRDAGRRWRRSRGCDDRGLHRDVRTPRRPSRRSPPAGSQMAAGRGRRPTISTPRPP